MATVTAARIALNRNLREAWALALLVFGGLLLPVVGWLLGVLLLWRSRAWTVRDKILGTLIVPGGLSLIPLLLILSLRNTTCTQRTDGKFACDGDDWWVIVAVVAAAAQVLMAVYLARRLRRAP